MRRAPLHIINILLRTLKGHQRFGPALGEPEFDSPVHGAGEEELSHFTVLVALALTWVHMNVSQGSMMIRKDALDIAILLLAEVDVEVLRANIKVVLVSLGKVEAVSIDRLPVVLATADWRLIRRHCCNPALSLLLRTEERVSLRVYKHSRSPIAHLTIVAD